MKHCELLQREPEEMCRHKWTESEKAGRDLGGAACCEWAGKHRIRHTLKGIALFGIAAMAAVSCASMRGRASRPQPFTFAQVCDTQLGMGGYEHDLKTFEQAVKQINAIEPDFVLICGDLVGKARADTFGDYTAIKAGFIMPAYSVPGNHDVGNKPSPESLAFYRETVGEDYFSFRHKGYAFVCVNTSLWKAPVSGETEKQDEWLSGVLASAVKDGVPVFIVAHYPLFTKAPDEAEAYSNLPPDKRQELLDLFERSGVVAMVTGHVHRQLVNDYNGIQLVSGQTTSKTHGGPLGFRLWHIMGQRPFKHESVDIEGF